MAQSRLFYLKWLKEAWFAELTDDARWLYLGLCCIAADDGVFKWDQGLMRGAVFATRPRVNIFAVLEELRACDLVRPFRAGGRNYGAIGGFGRHQHVRRAFVSGLLPADLQGYCGVGRLREVPQQIDFGFPTVPRLVPALDTPQKKRRHRAKTGRRAGLPGGA